MNLFQAFLLMIKYFRKCYYNVDQISVKLNTEIQKIHTWLTANKLTLNTTKTEFMIIGSKHNLTKVQTVQLLQLEIII